MYAKLFTSIYQGTLRGNSHGLLVFTNLLAHADKDGVVDIHPKAIAEEVGLSIDEVRASLLVLESPDDESRSPEEQGRRIIRMDEHRAWGWQVVNYVKYRAIRNEDDRREQNRIAQEKWREKNKPSSAKVSQAKQQSAHTEAEADTKAEAEKKNTKRVPRLTVEDLVSAGVDENHARDWMEIRRLKKQPLTQTAWAAVKAESEKAGLTIPQAIEAAAANGWGGFKASWLERSSNKTPQTFRERDDANARAKAAAWSGGILGQDQNTIDMEAPIGRISSC